MSNEPSLWTIERCFDILGCLSQFNENIGFKLSTSFQNILPKNLITIQSIKRFIHPEISISKTTTKNPTTY
jgi:hypothetical protein